MAKKGLFEIEILYNGTKGRNLYKGEIRTTTSRIGKLLTLFIENQLHNNFTYEDMCIVGCSISVHVITKKIRYDVSSKYADLAQKYIKRIKVINTDHPLSLTSYELKHYILSNVRELDIEISTLQSISPVYSDEDKELLITTLRNKQAIVELDCDSMKLTYIKEGDSKVRSLVFPFYGYDAWFEFIMI